MSVQNVYFWHGSSAVAGEGERSTNTLKNCAKTAVQINVQQASEFDEFQHVCSGEYRKIKPPFTRSPARASAHPLPPAAPAGTRAPPACPGTRLARAGGRRQALFHRPPLPTLSPPPRHLQGPQRGGAAAPAAFRSERTRLGDRRGAAGGTDANEERAEERAGKSFRVK